MKIVEPGKTTLEALDILAEHRTQFTQAGIKSLRDLSSMDVTEISRKMGVDPASLNKLKEMASRELDPAESAKKYETQKAE